MPEMKLWLRSPTGVFCCHILKILHGWNYASLKLSVKRLSLVSAFQDKLPPFVLGGKPPRNLLEV